MLTFDKAIPAKCCICNEPLDASIWRDENKKAHLIIKPCPKCSKELKVEIKEELLEGEET